MTTTDRRAVGVKQFKVVGNSGYPLYTNVLTFRHSHTHTRLVQMQYVCGTWLSLPSLQQSLWPRLRSQISLVQKRACVWLRIWSHPSGKSPSSALSSLDNSSSCMTKTVWRSAHPRLASPLTHSHSHMCWLIIPLSCCHTSAGFCSHFSRKCFPGKHLREFLQLWKYI